MDYSAFIDGKSASYRFGAAPCWRPMDALFPHQRALTAWALRKGRAAIFADTGMGKTLMQMEWAANVASVGRVLVVAPLAVAEQTVSESRRFGIDSKYLRCDDGVTKIVVTNYEMISRFRAADFVGVVLDESSILKSFTGATRTMLIDMFRHTPYRLACTATPAPNDFTELGNHSEFLGVKPRVEMLAEYFVHDGGSTQDWRIKGHARHAFWMWVASWGAMMRTPEDLGMDGASYQLPPLRMHEHIVRADHRASWSSGSLFARQASTLSDQRAVRRSTTSTRADIAADIASSGGPCVVWCELNAEADAVADATPGAVQIAGSDTPETKASRLASFADGSTKVLVTKPSIAGFGLNWQHCSRMVFVGASHSYEQTYQAIRRCWRFGQRNAVDVHIIRAEEEDAIVANYRRKDADAARMSAEMISHVKATLMADMGVSTREWNSYQPSTQMTIPGWVGQETP